VKSLLRSDYTPVPVRLRPQFPLAERASIWKRPMSSKALPARVPLAPRRLQPENVNHGTTTMRNPPAPCNKGRRCPARRPEGGHFYFTIEDELYIQQSNLPTKLIYLQKIRFESDARVEFRLGYYIIGKRPAMRGRWVWGQFATMIPKVDFLRITRMAKRRGWLS
jgi:hypothetical protein